MKIKYSSVYFVFLLSIIVSAGCKGKKPETKPEEVQVVNNPVVIGNETALLLKDLEESGDYVNSKEFPSLIKASIVNESLGKNILIVDIRPSTLFSEGHIKGAINKKFEDLPVYFESGIKPFEYEKIIIVSEDGQISSYTTSLLRLMGYGNVYSMRWGMSAWNDSYAKEAWFKGVSGKYETILEKSVNEKPISKGMPELSTDMATGSEIADARFVSLFKEGTSGILITADEVFSDPSKFFIVNLDRKDKYEDGHIPGAIRYKPEATLGFTEEMSSLPTDKTIVVYCGTGHNSGFATAYLRLFGYDARTLKYGNNSFMYNKMISQRATLGWLPFSREDVNNFSVVK